MDFSTLLKICLLVTCLLIIGWREPLAQTVLHDCGTDHLHTQLFGRNAQYAQRQREADWQIYHRMAQLGGPPSANRTEAATYNVPVVVHVMHRAGTPVGTGENISDAQILQGIQHLNDAFRKLPPFNGPGSADVDMEFCLARRNPTDGATTGINRVAVPDSLTDPLNSTYDLVLKNQIRWDPTRYVNIWLVKEIFMPGFGFAVAGYAYLAGAHGTSFDGIVNEARWFGSSVNNSKIHIHEMGHYLNLYHTFEAGCPNANCLLNGDRVCDTPPDNSKAGVSCGSIVNTCATDPDDPAIQNPFRPILSGGLGDQPDMINNYMDYGYQSCQNAFTAGQRDRMVAALTGVRQSLIATGNLACQPPCGVGVTASFSPSAGPTVSLGTTINFTNSSLNGTDYAWIILNGPTTVSSAITPNHAYTFALPGTYTVRLQVRNLTPPNDVRCLPVVSEQTIQVICPAMTVNFTPSATNIVAGNSVTFTNFTTGAVTYEWFINGMSFSNIPNPVYLFNTQGSYAIRLRATDGTGTCSFDNIQTITVTCPVSAFFTPSATAVFLNTTIVCLNNSVSASAQTWKLFPNGSPVPIITAGSTNFSYLFTATGSYELQLIATNGICNDTARQFLSVRDPARCEGPGAKVWHFGSRAGLNFNVGPPPTGLNNVSVMSAPEGCASVTDEFGNLLFYTNGQTAYARNHTVMLNGTGLLGSPNSVQSAQTVPAPGANNLFYLFTTDADGGQGTIGGGGNQGLRVSLINTLANSGLGSVVTGRKNILLDNEASEKLIATMHGNGCDVWAVSHRWGSNEFRAYLISSATDLSAPAAIPRQSSLVGSVVQYVISPASNSPILDGQMKISPDGSRLAMATVSVPRQGSSQGFVELFDFDNQTGNVSNVRRIYTANNDYPYGVEFSPNGNLLYVTTYPANPQLAGKPHLYQFNLLAGAGTAAAITASRLELQDPSPDNGNFGLYGLQLAVDNKVYVATEDQRGGRNQVGVVNSPNNPGSGANYLAVSVNLGTALPPGGEAPLSLKGLPAPVPVNFLDFDFTYDCEAQRTRFTLNKAYTTIQEVIWDFGDGILSNDVNPLHTYSASGPFNIKMSVLGACACKTISKTITLPQTCVDLSPLQLLAFQAFLQPKTQKVDLLWQTAWEQNTDRFEVERSEDGQSFGLVGQLPASGASPHRRDYAFADRLPWAAPVWYYRLRMVDTNGEATYSPVVAVYGGGSVAPLRVYPLPAGAGQRLYFDLALPVAAPVLHLEWVDLPGRTIRRETLTTSGLGWKKHPLTTLGLAPGVYWLRASSGGWVVGQCKVLVE